MKAGVSLVRVNPLSGNGASLAERTETTLKDVHSVVKRTGWMVSILIYYTPALKKKGGMLFWIYLSVCLSVNFLHFHPLLHNRWGYFNKTWHKAFLGERDSIFFK